MKRFEDYKELVPKRLLKAVNSLNDLNRFALLLALTEAERSYQELIEMGFSTGKLYNHLQHLLKNGLIENFYQRKEGSRHYSFYRIAPFGHTVLESILGIMETSLGSETIDGAAPDDYAYLKVQSSEKGSVNGFSVFEPESSCVSSDEIELRS